MSRATIVVGVLLATVLAGCTGPDQSQTKATIADPGFSPGDRWEYRTANGTTIVKTVLAVTMDTTNGTEFEHRVISVDNTTYESWIRASDGATLVSNQHEFRGSLSINGYDPPYARFFGQHAVASTWKSEYHSYWWSYRLDTQEKFVLSEYRGVEEFRLVGLEDKSGPWGSTKAWHIQKIAGEGVPLEEPFDIWYSPEFCSEVGSSSDLESGIGSTTLIHASCAKGIASLG